MAPLRWKHLSSEHTLCSIITIIPSSDDVQVNPQALSCYRIFLRLYLGLDNECFVSSDGNLLLHDAEVVELADEQPGAVQPQGEVHIVAGEAVLVVLNVLTPLNVEEEEIVKVTSGERLPLLNT